MLKAEPSVSNIPRYLWEASTASALMVPVGSITLYHYTSLNYQRRTLIKPKLHFYIRWKHSYFIVTKAGISSVDLAYNFTSSRYTYSKCETTIPSITNPLLSLRSRLVKGNKHITKISGDSASPWKIPLCMNTSPRTLPFRVKVVLHDNILFCINCCMLLATLHMANDSRMRDWIVDVTIVNPCHL